ncbi:MAG: 30S ribosomal protein S16 [Fluviicola sp.]|nr:30S ribosomal protein S16 [Fluviicola sp.]
MATKIRLQRHGKKARAFYHIVAADTRAPRDGKFIEKLGTYNPNTNPATIDIDFDRTMYWVQEGAEMTDTARALLSYKGILYKNHLIKGVAKGALTEEQVEERFAQWLKEKEDKIATKTSGLEKDAVKAKADALKAEADVNATRAKEIEAKNTPVEATPEVDASEETATEGNETATETPVVEEAPVAEEVVESAPEVTEAAEEKAPEVEAKKEEAPAADASTSSATAPTEEPKAE